MMINLKWRALYPNEFDIGEFNLEIADLHYYFDYLDKKVLNYKRRKFLYYYTAYGNPQYLIT